MNYYEHHIRDYDAATSHLTWEEDLAYTRLLRWYYRKEQPIPASIPEACRQVRAVTKVQKDAVASVLREFFELRDDGWHKDTCDEVISAFQAGEPEREAKKKNEDTRLARHRAERAELFGVINAAGQHMNWNTPIAELRAAAERVRSAAATGTATQPATFQEPPATATATPATATHGNAHPLPTPHSPGQANASVPDGTGAPAPPAPPPPEPPTDRDLVFANGVTLLTAAGVTDRNARSFLAAQCKAHGESAVRQALDRCATERPIDPVPWIVASLGVPATATKPRKSDALMAGNVAAAQRFLEGVNP